MRVHPPAPVGSPRTIAATSGGGQLVCSRWVPSGTTVNVHPYAANHSPVNFRSPERYAPERWLGDEEYQDDSRAAFQPFSYGARNCLGQSMAWHEIRLVFGTLLSKFDLELCEDSRGWMPGKAFVVWEKKPLMIRLKAIEA